MFGTPTRTSYDVCFSLFGIPVQVHPFFWLTAVLLGGVSREPDLKMLLCWIGALFLAILVHELGHALVIKYVFGADPWIVLYGLGGAAMHQQYYRIRQPRTFGRIFISFAGPLAGFLLAGLCIGIKMTSFPGNENLYFASFLFYMIFIGIFWGAINLLPILPLDGGNIAREICLWFSPWKGEVIALQLSLISAIVVAAFFFAKLHQPFAGFMFAIFALMNYQTLTGRSRW